MAQNATSFDTFIASEDRLLNIEIMLSFYSRVTLFSDKGREEFAASDLQKIPLHVS